MLDGCLFGLRATENDDAKSSGSSVLSSASATVERNNAISVLARYAHYQSRHGPNGESRDQWTELASVGDKKFVLEDCYDGEIAGPQYGNDLTGTQRCESQVGDRCEILGGWPLV
jgi:hypothetical protein